MPNKDLFKGRKCECCGHTELLSGVASSSLGAMSILWCQLCLNMQAEPKWMIDMIFEQSNWRSKYGKDAFTYYDPELDNYVKYGSKEIINLSLKDGTEFKNRSELIKWIEEQDEKNKTN